MKCLKTTHGRHVYDGDSPCMKCGKDKRDDQIEALSQANLKLGKKLASIRALVALQAEDPALWATPLQRLRTAHEAYLQQALRRLHAVIESE